MAEKSPKWLRHCSIRDSCGHRSPNPKTPSSWDLERHNCFDQYYVLMFSRSDVGALWSFLTLRMWFEKRFRELSDGSVLWFGFLFVVVSRTVSFSPPRRVLSVPRAAQAWERLLPSPFREVKWGRSPLCVLVKGRVTQYLWIFRDSVFLRCLSNGCNHFICFQKIRKKKVLSSPFHSLLSELWSLAFLLKTTSTDTLVCLPPHFLCLFYFIFCLLPSSHIFFSLRAVTGQVCLWFGITELFPCVCPRAAWVWDKSPYNGLAPIVCTV